MDAKTMSDARAPELYSDDISYAALCETEPEWSALIAGDDPYSLTASPIWTRTWWAVYESVLVDPEWRGIAVRDANQKLLGLALFYLHRVSLRGIKIRRLELVGQCWRSGLGPRSEYGGVIAPEPQLERVTEAVFKHVAAWKDWDELIIGNAPQDSRAASLRSTLAADFGWYCRSHELGTTYSMPLAGSFEEYRSGLPGKFRQRVFNHREKLGKQGILVSRSAGLEETGDFLDTLNAFHQQRWGKPVFEDHRLRFHRQITPLLLENDQLYLNMMEVDGRPVSILYDIVAGSTKYGFQLGFDGGFDTKVSLFSVHLGFSIEDAFERRLSRFDMLRGHGRSGRDYKEKVATPFHNTATEQYIRSPGLRVLGRVYDLLGSVRGSRVPSSGQR